MPIIQVHMLLGRNPVQIRGLVEDITKAFVLNCDVSADEVNIVINEIEPRRWATGGILVNDVSSNPIGMEKE